jgi:hypothetical protein
VEHNEDGDVNIVGWTLLVNVDEILDAADRYHGLISAMERDDFAFMKEYSGAKRLLNSLKLKYGKAKKNLINVI